ncbi:MAG TPA: HDOD domain-containing protein, partial [Polyangia bacterium]|nr:HDOD domain-containing protein [Polyangia bacterium]
GSPHPKTSDPDSVLIIDSEEGLRRTLESALSRQGYRVTGSADPDEALRIAGAGPLHAIILGDKQAQLDAPVVLRRWSQSRVVAPVVVTGVAQTTTERVIENLRAGAIEFVRKPLQPAVVMDAIQRAVIIARRRQAEPPVPPRLFPDSVVPRGPAPMPPEMAAILDLAREAPVEIPASPIIVNEVLHTISQARTSLDDVARLLQYDPSMSREALVLANGSKGGRGLRTSDIKTAVARLGLKQLAAVVDGIGQRACFVPRAEPLRDFLNALWRYSAAAGVAMRVLAELLGPAARLDSAVAYGAGLFRDIGAAFLIRLISEQAATADPAVYLLFVRQRHESVSQHVLSGVGLDPAIGQVAGSHHAQSAPTGSSLYWPLSAVAAEVADTVVAGGDVTRLLRRGAAFTATSADTLHISEGLLRKATDQVAAEISSVSALFA